MTARYRLDPGLSRFTVQAFAAGMLSFLGHSPTFAVREYSGRLSFAGGTVEGMQLELTVRADSLVLVDQVRDADRREIEETMRRDVLETAAYPEIRYEAAQVAAQTVVPGHQRVRISGRLTLHGVTRPRPVDAELLIFEDGIRLRGGAALLLSDYRIRPVTALGGTIRLKDELRVLFDLAAPPEGS
jgi:polyisoprenoid-binding protein YceI